MLVYKTRVEENDEDLVCPPQKPVNNVIQAQYKSCSMERIRTEPRNAIFEVKAISAKSPKPKQ